MESVSSASDPDVIAAGDCCSFPHPLYGGRRMRLEAWRPGPGAGAVAARNLPGACAPFDAVPSFWTDQYELTVQIVGLPRLATTEVSRRRRDGVAIFFGLGTDGRLLSTSAIGPGNAVAKDTLLAQELIARRAAPGPVYLTNPDVKLRCLLPAS